VFIAHDLSVVQHISDRVMVMYLGKAVEAAPAAEIYARPRHPYTAALLDAVPIPDPLLARRGLSEVVEGDVPSPLNAPGGCSFHPRCPRFHAGHCDLDTPHLAPVTSSHKVACHYPLEAQQP
jgi:oligopeptide/dipeptide ABC transporter ATP-binding protein